MCPTAQHQPADSSEVHSAKVEQVQVSLIAGPVCEGVGARSMQRVLDRGRHHGMGGGGDLQQTTLLHDGNPCIAVWAYLPIPSVVSICWW